MNTRQALLISAVLAVGSLAVVGISQAVAGGFGFGANSNATARDVGLPFYPGARPHKDGKDDDSAANVWGSAGSFGMRIVAVGLETGDAPNRVAGYYNGALRKYGPILDCSYGKPRPPKADKNSQRLDCSDDHPKPGEFILKAGMKREFHLVSVQPLGRGSEIGLVYIQIRGFN